MQIGLAQKELSKFIVGKVGCDGRALKRHGEPILMLGHPGVGKTSIIQQVTAQLKYDLILEHPCIADPTDYKGLPMRVNGHAEFVPIGSLRMIIEAKKNTVVLFDDLPHAAPAVQAPIMQLILARRIGEHKVSDFVTFIAAGNRREDKAGVHNVIEPLKTRFSTIINIEQDLDAWLNWARTTGIATSLTGFIRWQPHFILDWKPGAGMQNTPSARAVENVDTLLHLGIESRAALAECVVGAAGQEFSNMFFPFLEIFENLPDADKILADPMNGDIPVEDAVMHALCASLARRASKKVAKNLFIYIDRLTAEYATVLYKDSIQHCPEIEETKACTDWRIANASLLV